MIDRRLLLRKGSMFLNYLYSHESPSLRDVARGADIDRSVIDGLFNRFEAYGLIVSWRDGRCRRVNLTEKGRLVAERLNLVIVGWGEGV